MTRIYRHGGSIGKAKRGNLGEASLGNGRSGPGNGAANQEERARM